MIVFLINLFVVLLVITIYKKFKVPKEISHIPGLSFISSIILFIKNEPIDITVETILNPFYNQYKLIRLWTIVGWVVKINDYSTIKQIMSDNNKYKKLILLDIFPYSHIANFLGRNVIFSNGQEWKMHKKIINPFFKREFKTDLFYNKIEQLLLILDQHQELELTRLINQFTLDVLGKVILNYDFDTINGKESKIVYHYSKAAKNPWSYLDLFYKIDFSKIPFLNSMNLHVKLFKEEIRRIINQKEKLINKTKDLNPFDHFLLETKDSVDFSDDDIIEIQDKARKEVFEVIKLNYPSNQDLKNLKYLNAVIKEATRFYPPTAKMQERICMEDFKVGDIIIPKGSILICDLISLRSNEKLFPNPNEFNPDRFLGVEKFDYIFGGGSRSCIDKIILYFLGAGYTLSINEQLTLLSMILKRYIVSPSPNQNMERLSLGSRRILDIKSLKLKFKKISA